MSETHKPPSPRLPRKRAGDSRFDAVTLAGFGFLLLSLIVGVLGYRASHDAFDVNLLLIDYYANLSTELGSIAVVIIVVDRLNKRQERRGRELLRLRRQLLHDLRTPHLEDARKALELIMQRGWLWDGSLEDANFARANLRGAVLYLQHERNLLVFHVNDDFSACLRGADLRQADLRSAILTHADLRDANLKDALLEGADLAGVVCNHNTILPDETLWTPETDLGRFTEITRADFWRPAARHS